MKARISIRKKNKRDFRTITKIPPKLLKRYSHHFECMQIFPNFHLLIMIPFQNTAKTQYTEFIAHRVVASEISETSEMIFVLLLLIRHDSYPILTSEAMIASRHGCRHWLPISPFFPD